MTRVFSQDYKELFMPHIIESITKYLCLVTVKVAWFKWKLLESSELFYKDSDLRSPYFWRPPETL